jgi:hypothetical protein
MFDSVFIILRKDYNEANTIFNTIKKKQFWFLHLKWKIRSVENPFEVKKNNTVHTFVDIY